MTKVTTTYGFSGKYIKIESEFSAYGVCGTRGRMACAIIERIKNSGFDGVVYACGRDNIDMALISRVSNHFGLTCDIFTTTGCVTEEMEKTDATIHRVANGYNNVLNARARDYADTDANLAYIPMGFTCRAAIETTMHQLAVLPQDLQRIVVYDESGVTVASIALGLSYYGRNDVSVLGVTTKQEPYSVVTRLLGIDVLDRPQVTYMFTRVKQTTSNDAVKFDGMELNPRSDAHCIKHLTKGDMFWICDNGIL